MHRIKKLKVREAGDMIASQPYNPNQDPSLSDLIVRELDKLREKGSLSPLIYTRAREQAYGQSKVLNNIYRSTGRDLRPVIIFLLRQVRNRLK